MRRLRSLIAALIASASALAPASALAQATILTSTPALHATLGLTSAQILTANSAPVLVLAAPPTGFSYQVEKAALQLFYNTTTYVSTGCGIYYHGTALVATASDFNSTVQGTASAIGLTGGVNTGDIAIANVAGLGLDFKCTSANPTTGNSPFKLTLTYLQIPN